MPIFNITKPAAAPIADPANANEVPEEKKPEVLSVMRIEGPLSNVFTDALQKELANETHGIDSSVLMYLQDQENISEPEQQDVYVYCCDTDKMTQNELIDSVDKLKIALDSGNYKRLALIAEQKDVNKRLASLEGFARSIGVEVYYNSNTAASNIAHYKRS